MSLKLFLNKYLKVDNIEYYTLPCLQVLQKEYDKLLKKTEGLDPDFPQLNFGDGNGNSLSFDSKHKLDSDAKKLIDKLWDQKAGMKD